jgi:hypothetical protein
LVATLPLVYIIEEPEAFAWVDAALVDARDTMLVELVVDDRVSFGSMLDLPSQDLVVWKLVIGEVGDEGLRPGRCYPGGEDALFRRLHSPHAQR